MTLADALSQLDGKTVLDADDAIALRRIIFGGDALVGQDEADALFKLNGDAGSLSPEWRDLFIETMTDFVVRQQEPAGYVDQAKSDWLIASVSNHGRVREDEIETLVHILETADQTPAQLSAFVLGMMKTLILHRIAQRGDLTHEDVESLRRVLYAAGGEGNIAVTRHEAEALFDINDALNGASTNPAWRDLFMRAVANAVLFETPWKPDADAETQREAWLEDTSVHPLKRLTILEHPYATLRAVHELPWFNRDHLTSFQRDLGKAVAADEALETRAEQITADEAHWLVERIGRNGRFDANEQALIAFIRANARALDPTIEALLAQLDALPSVDGLATSDAQVRPAFGHRLSNAAI